MQELEQRSGGRWRPSAGSIYPTLQQLEDERLISVEELDGRRTFQLTDAGRTAAGALPGERAWTGGRGGHDDLRGLSRELAAAAMQVGRVGSPSAVEEARLVLADARRRLYRLLADDEAASPTASERADARDRRRRPRSSPVPAAPGPTLIYRERDPGVAGFHATDPPALDAGGVERPDDVVDIGGRRSAASSPPEVCGSWARVTSSGATTFADLRAGRTKRRLWAAPPVSTPARRGPGRRAAPAARRPRRRTASPTRGPSRARDRAARTR